MIRANICLAALFFDDNWCAVLTIGIGTRRINREPYTEVDVCELPKLFFFVIVAFDTNALGQWRPIEEDGMMTEDAPPTE